MNQIRVGVIGTGSMGLRHCRVYSNLRRAQLVGICDAAPQVGRQVAQQYGVPYYQRLDDLLEHVDAVSLAAPTPLHFDLAMRCLARDVHLLVEKPVTETIEQAEELTRVAEASGLTVMVGHIERFNSAYGELKNVLDGMTVLAVNLRRLSPYVGSNKAVDVVLDLMIHDTNLVLDLVGQEPVAVNAHGLTAFSGMIDHAVANLYFESGPLITMTASRVVEQKVRSIEVAATEAYLECDLLNKSVLVHRSTVGEYQTLNRRGTRYRQESIVEHIYVPIFEPLFYELQHFVDCIAEGKPTLVPAREGLKALQLAVRIQKAIHAQLIDTRSRLEPVAANISPVASLLAR